MTTPVKGSRPQREGGHVFEYEAMPLQPPISPSDAESKQVALISSQELQQQRATFHDTYLNGYGNNNTNSEKRSMEKKPSFGNFGPRTRQSTRLLDADSARLTISGNDGKDNSSIYLSNAENGGNIRREETTSISDNKDCNKPAVILAEDKAFELVKPLDLNKIQAQRARRAKATYSAYIRHRSLKATVSYDVDTRK
ncbi:hypothetical protein BGZ81_005453 [Podila clonocystis]|nr:hypothetical protein BGZ81_005453 [Podila clonocystis]